MVGVRHQVWRGMHHEWQQLQWSLRWTGMSILQCFWQPTVGFDLEQVLHRDPSCGFAMLVCSRSHSYVHILTAISLYLCVISLLPVQRKEKRRFRIMDYHSKFAFLPPHCNQVGCMLYAGLQWAEWRLMVQSVSPAKLHWQHPGRPGEQHHGGWDGQPKRWCWHWRGTLHCHSPSCSALTGTTQYLWQGKAWHASVTAIDHFCLVVHGLVAVTMADFAWLSALHFVYIICMVYVYATLEPRIHQSRHVVDLCYPPSPMQVFVSDLLREILHWPTW